MSNYNRLNDKINLINQILNSYDLGSKEKTLAFQRGLLTAILARAAIKDWEINKELQERLKLIKSKQ